MWGGGGERKRERGEKTGREREGGRRREIRRGRERETSEGRRERRLRKWNLHKQPKGGGEEKS